MFVIELHYAYRHRAVIYTSLRSCTWFSARDRVVREGGKQSGILSRRKSKTSSSKYMWAEHQVGKPRIVFETRPRQLSVLPCLVLMRMSIYTMSCIIHVLYM